MLRRARIVLVEDEGLIARDIQLSLEELGHTVASVADTAEIRDNGRGFDARHGECVLVAV